MVRGRYNRIKRTVGLALAALFTLAAPLASNDALAAEPTAKAETAKADKAPAKKTKKRGKTAKQDANAAHTAHAAQTKKPGTSNKKSAVTTPASTVSTASTTHAGSGGVVHAKQGTSKSTGTTVTTSTASAKKPTTSAPTKDKPHAITKPAPKQTTTTTASTRAASASKKASARAPGAKRKTGKKPDSDAERPPCHAATIAIDRNGLEAEAFSLVDCKGKPLDAAREKLSVLARPWGTPRPIIEPLTKEAKAAKKAKKTAKRAGGKDKPGEPVADAGEIAPNVRLLDPGLLSRIDTLSRHFSGKHISVVSGYRPRSRGSLHQTARAIDLRVTGVSNEEVVTFCKTITDTGCGYYPNSSFVHVDVRAPGTGSVSWIDASGPGESPRYVSAWPPPPEAKAPDADVHDGATAEGIEDEVMREATKPAAGASGTTPPTNTPTNTTSDTKTDTAPVPKVTKEADPKDPVPGAPTNPSPAKPDAAPKETAAPRAD